MIIEEREVCLGQTCRWFSRGVGDGDVESDPAYFLSGKRRGFPEFPAAP